MRPVRDPKAKSPARSYRYIDLVTVAFVTVLLCANLIGPAKIAQVGPITFGAGVLFFPISYIFGDVLTEVYGYARARRVVWSGFAALAFASFMASTIHSAVFSSIWISLTCSRNRADRVDSLIGGAPHRALHA